MNGLTGSVSSSAMGASASVLAAIERGAVSSLITVDGIKNATRLETAIIHTHVHMNLTIRIPVRFMNSHVVFAVFTTRICSTVVATNTPVIHMDDLQVRVVYVASNIACWATVGALLTAFMSKGALHLHMVSTRPCFIIAPLDVWVAHHRKLSLCHDFVVDSS